MASTYFLLSFGYVVFSVGIFKNVSVVIVIT